MTEKVRRTWRQDATTGKLVEVTRSRSANKAAHVRDDIQSYVSPIDGSIISSRSREREHNKRHGVSNDLDSLKEKAGDYQKRREAPETKEYRNQRKRDINEIMRQKGL